MAQTKTQKDTIDRVMGEFKRGVLPRGKGGWVRNPKQAIAIALSEAGASNRRDEGTNRRRLAKTKRRAGAAAGGPTRQELYEQARRQGVPGRARMTKAELERALR